MKSTERSDQRYLELAHYLERVMWWVGGGESPELNIHRTFPMYIGLLSAIFMQSVFRYCITTFSQPPQVILRPKHSVIACVLCRFIL